jgi:hypothetical protein
VSEETRQQRYDRQTRESFEELGRFVQSFEAMVDAARTGSLMIATNSIPQLRKVISIVFHHQALSAKPLMEIFRAIVMEFLRDDAFRSDMLIDDKERDTYLGVIKQLHIEYEELANIRNNLLHGTWYIGYANDQQQDFEEFRVLKFRTNKTGSGYIDDLPKTAKELKKLRERCEKVRDWIQSIPAFFAFRREGKIRISGNYIYDTKSKTWKYHTEIKRKAAPEP